MNPPSFHSRIRKVCTLVAATLILPALAYAQQNDLADPQTTQKVFAAIYKGFAEARNNNDAAAIAAHYTRDAVFVTPDGPIIGREAIQKWYTDLYQFWQPKNLGGKADGNALHVIGTAGNEFWATGEWSETGQGKNGEPIPIKGYWASIYVREGDDWKIRLDAWNESPERVHQSFAPQPAATPSATASPSGQ
jgi:ketosteroid isomerase-like protein